MELDLRRAAALRTPAGADGTPQLAAALGSVDAVPSMLVDALPRRHSAVQRATNLAHDIARRLQVLQGAESRGSIGADQVYDESVRLLNRVVHAPERDARAAERRRAERHRGPTARRIGGQKNT